MDFTKARERAMYEADLLTFMAMHGNLCLALRHPKNQGPSRDMILKVCADLGRLLVDRGFLTLAERELADKTEQQEARREAATTMTDERFNVLVNGPLAHPMIPFAIMRIASALRYVVEATGPEGTAALEHYCEQREEQDFQKGLEG